MHFDVHIQQRECPAILARTLTLLTPQLLNKRLQQFSRMVSSNPFISGYLRQWFQIETAIEVLRKYKKTTGRLPEMAKEEHLAIHKAFAFMGMLCRVHSRLSTDQQKALNGRITQGMTSDEGLASLAHEMQVAANIMLAGFDVEWNDLSGDKKTFDLLGRKGDLEVEFECKTFTNDLGRKIHFERQFLLANAIRKDIAKALSLYQSFVLDISIPDRLDGGQVNRVAAATKTALENFQNATFQGVCSINIIPLDHEGPVAQLLRPRPGMLTQDQVTTWASKHLSTELNRFMFLAGAGPGIAVISLRSEKPDKVTDGIYRQLKEASDQLSGSRPGFICGAFLDMTADQLEELAATGRNGARDFHLMMTRFLSSDARRHVHTVEFISAGRISSDTVNLGATIHSRASIGTPSYSFLNNKNSMVNDPRLIWTHL